MEQQLHELSTVVTNDWVALNAAINHVTNLESASAACFNELCKTMNRNTKVLSRRMNHHHQELDASREEVVPLNQALEDLQADKVILEARVNNGGALVQVLQRESWSPGIRICGCTF